MNEKKLKKQKKQEAESSQVMLVFVAAAILLWGVSYLFKVIDRGTTYMLGLTITKVICIIAALASIITLFWYRSERQKGLIKENAVFHVGILSLFLAVLSVCCGILLYNHVLGMRLLYVFVPCLAILFLVFKVYDRRFFVLCVCVGYSIFAMYLFFKLSLGEELRLVGLVSAVVLDLIPVALSFLPKKNAVRLALLNVGAEKVKTVTVYLATVAALVLAFFIGGHVALALLFAEVIFLIVASIYFTVKLI